MSDRQKEILLQLLKNEILSIENLDNAGLYERELIELSDLIETER